MTQQEALAAVREKLPAIAEGITVERKHSLGKVFGHPDEFIIWDHSGGSGPQTGRCSILAISQHSWEHAISLIEADRINAQPVDTSVEAWF